uniref:Uncharacterized protein n=1 Tax=Fagus sylvatica TaxID=28930 RepID=A0A2N9J406_FAGSY
MSKGRERESDGGSVATKPPPPKQPLPPNNHHRDTTCFLTPPNLVFSLLDLPFSPPVWPGARGVDMNMLAVAPGLSPVPPGPSGPRFPPNMGNSPPAMYFNQPGPGPGRGVPPNISPEFFGTKFDVILVDPPWEEYVHRAPGVADHMEYWTFEEIMNLKIEAIADTPSFIFLWVGDGVGLEQGRQCLKKSMPLSALPVIFKYSSVVYACFGDEVPSAI